MSTVISYDQTVQTPALAGVVAGADVLTMEGYRDIGTLKAGDRIITRRGVRVLRDITSRTETFCAFLISPSTLGFSRPSERMRVAPGQKILVRDWRAQALFGETSIVLPIERLVDEKHITTDENPAEYTVYDLEFDTAEILYVDGVEMVCGELDLCDTPNLASIAA